jgi:RimJ/RimL family protein N-acetyltransferase
MGKLHEQGHRLSARVTAIICRPDGIPYAATIDGNTLLVQKAYEAGKSTWQLNPHPDQLVLEWITADSGVLSVAELLVAIEACFLTYPQHDQLKLDAGVADVNELMHRDLVLRDETNGMIVKAELFWQQPAPWLPQPQPYAFPLTDTRGQNLRHPLRPPKPVGVVYQRYIPWLSATLSFRTVDLHHHLESFSRWMNDPIVAAAWREEGELAKHRAYLENINGDPHVIALVASLDDQPFGYFEVYWAKEDRIAPFYDADDFDRGWHVLIGEPGFRGKPFVTAWLPSISHYLFLNDCRTQRIVIEPRSDNYKMIRNLGKCGYAILKEFDFPHKRATLAMLLRERFFADRHWIPKDNRASPSSISLP